MSGRKSSPEAVLAFLSCRGGQRGGPGGGDVTFEREDRR